MKNTAYAETRSKRTDPTPVCVEPKRILLAEDDSEMRALLSMALQRSGYDVVECSDGIGMLTCLASFFLPDEYSPDSLDLIISDIRMPGITALKVLEGKPEKHDFLPMILITTFGDEETHILAKQFGAAALIDKPFDVDLLLQKVQEVLSETRILHGRDRKRRIEP